MIDSYTLKKLQMAFPSKNIIKCYKKKFGEILVAFDDGTMSSYRDGYSRRVPSDPSLMTADQVKKEFAIRLRDIMYAKFVSQEELSKRTGISQSTISSYVNGKNCPSYAIADKIARALDCSMDDFRL